MASPFNVFRRNQKVMLAVVGVAAMVAFVFLDPLMNYLRRGQGPQNPVVVQTKYGAYKESELASIRQSRELVDAFLRATSLETIDALIASGNLDARMRDRIAENLFGAWKSELMRRSKEGPEEAALETLILAKKAQQLGMVVSDRTINEMLRQWTQDSLTSDSLQAIVNSLHTGRRISVARLFEAIRTEMLASKFSQMFVRSVVDIPPAQKFEYYSRVNRQAKAEIMPLAVADFASQVPDPSAETLEKFFNEHKDRLPDAASPDPGFKVPRRAAFQYFKADMNKFRDEFKPKVTEEEIREYYDKNKAQFQALELPSGPQDGADSAPAEEAPKEGEAPKTEPSDETSKPEGEKPEAEKPAAETPAQEKAADAAAEKPDDKSSAVPRPTLRLVSATTTVDEAKSDEPKPAETKAAEKPADPATPPADAPAAETPAEKPADKPADEAPAAAKPAEPKYEPLEKVQDQIRDIIAGQKAGAKIGEIFDELSAQMRRYADEIDIYNTSKESDPKLQRPKPFPFAELAKANGVEAKELPLVSDVEVAGEDIGKVHRIIRDPRSQFGFRTEPFVDFAFSDSLPTYKANVVEDAEGNAYLFWKNQEEATYVPKLDQVRDKVLAAWKMIEARPLARKRAGELAVQARAAEKPLKEVFANQPSLKVIDTGSFSWMTTGNVPQDQMGGPPRLSTIEGVEHIGNAFMQAVFELSAGEVGVASNHPEDTVYVVRLEEYDQSMDTLRDEFAKERPAVYMAVAAPDQRRMYLAWLSDLEKDAKVHWVRPPDTGRRGGHSEQMPADYDEDF